MGDAVHIKPPPTRSAPVSRKKRVKNAVTDAMPGLTAATAMVVPASLAVATEGLDDDIVTIISYARYLREHFRHKHDMMETTRGFRQ